ncbi:hypothetical protein AAFF_G00042660 [Aldrovandia affinis]|uniref:USP domain-containing protein n=1 Tax=Aldrovandia affinis TaxID=143900 RepID=A0AAD7VYA5_9TELE|nr:hypothetical protein AAFF_G00042660 [Aldrovandia affinis]
MNSVIQQLYMIPPIRNGILAIEGTGSDVDDDTSGDEKQDSESNVDPRDEVFSYHHQFEEKPSLNKSEDRKEYNIGVLRHLQVIFGHLATSPPAVLRAPRLLEAVPVVPLPRLWGEPVNLREQHDALEFFNSLVDSLDEALKALGHPAMLSKILGAHSPTRRSARAVLTGGGHKRSVYECEESFTTLNVDIRNHQNLLDSMEQYVKGDLLEGPTPTTVDTVKRLLIRKLPPVLAIQLKRFDYDWERECAIKFNDYFEFPCELDMEPYTVAGVAKLEGEGGGVPGDDDVASPEGQGQVTRDEPVVDGDGSGGGVGDDAPGQLLKYRLAGVLVHSGQASGGHYYSYIVQRSGDGDGGSATAGTSSMTAT